MTTEPVPESAALPTVAILAGGLGSRLGEKVASVPKPLVEVAGEPFIFHALRRLAAADAKHVVLCVGYLGKQIESVVGAEHLGMQISYSFDGPDLDGTLGALRRASHLLGDRFLVSYADTILTLDYAAMVDTWDRSGLPAVMAVLENHDQWGPSNASVAGDLVLAHDKVNSGDSMTWIDYGVGGMTSSTLSMVDPDERDLSVLYSLLAQRHLLAAFRVAHRFYEIGTPEALAETERHLSALGED